MEKRELLEKLLDDFVFLDHRLGDHPKLRANVFLEERESSEYLPTKLPLSPIRKIHTEYGRGHALSHFGGRRGYLFTSNQNKGTTAGVESTLGVPLIDGNEFVGALFIDSNHPGFLKEAHLGLGQLLSALLVYALEQVHPGVKLVTPASVELGRALTQVRHELNLTQVTLAERIGTSRIAVSRWEGGAQPPTFGPLYSWCESLGLLSPTNHALVTVAGVSPEFIRMLREDPEKLRQLSPEQFENFVAERLDRMGFDVRLTRGTFQKDGGIDLIAVPKARTVGACLIAGQVKHHRGGARSGIADVQRLLARKNSIFRLGLLITNTDFTQDARWHAAKEDNRFFLRLRSFEDIKRWIEDNFTSEEDWREIPDRIEITRGVWIEVPKPRVANSLQIWPLDKVDVE